MANLNSTLAELLLEKFEPGNVELVTEWLPIWRRVVEKHKGDGPYVAAIAAALNADRMAWAFYSGYQGALQASFPEILNPVEPRIASFGVNEAGRKITEVETSLYQADGHIGLRGSKSWVLAGIHDMDLYVLARTLDGPARGPGSLCIVRVPRFNPGVEMGLPRPQSVVPELPHCAVAFEDVAIESDQILSGDGYAEFARPFRLREDVSVTGCTLAYLLAQGHRAGWSSRWRQRCMAVIVALGNCAALSPTDTSTELLTAGALSFASDLIAEAEDFWLADSDSLVSQRWKRDKTILGLGKDARKQRVQSAWAATGLAEPSP